MSLEYLILIGVWVLSILLLLLIPRAKIRLALIAFLFKQAITYLFGLVTVEQGLLWYPIRFLPEINRTSITYEFMALPAVCAISISYFPYNRKRWIQIGYYAGIASILTIGEVLLEKYTDLIIYLHWNWFWSLSTIFITFVVTQLFCNWYFKVNHARAIVSK